MSTSQVRAVATGTAPAQKSIYHYLMDDTKIQKGISAVAGSYFTADRFLRLAVNAVKKTPLLLQCDPQSVLGSFMASAALGLEPNTVQQQAFLIPYKKRIKVGNQWVDSYDCQFQVGYRGFITLAHRSEYIASIEAEAIHEHDHFKHMKGSNAFLEYEKRLKDRGDLVGAYCFTKLESGIEVATVLPCEEILKIRSKSETFNALTRNVESAENAKEKAKAQQKLDDTPWVMWFDDMASKSAIKKHAKQLPLMPNDSITAAAALDSGNDNSSNVIDMAAMADPDVARSVVKEGMEAPAALTDDQSQDVDFTPRNQREAETIEVRTTQQSPRTAQAKAGNPAQGAATAAPASAGDMPPTYNDVAKALREAKTVDRLDEAGDQIRDVEDDNERGDLEHIYSQRRAEFEVKTEKQPARRTSNASME